MDVVVRAHHAEVSDKFRQHAVEKLAKVERLDGRLMRLEVCVSEERNPRLSDHKERVEITVHSKGPLIRAEASAPDLYAALDIALDRLTARLRKAADKRRIHHGMRTPDSLHSRTATSNGRAAGSDADHVGEAVGDADDEDTDHGIVVREKLFESRPMTLDDALLQMELVGHNFFLFPDAETGQPSVVYRRKGYDYGVIRLQQ
jgi:ribosomal subunit interface protein